VLAERGAPAKRGKRKPGVAPRSGRAKVRRAAAEKRVALAPLRRRITEAEAAVARLSAKIRTIDSVLAEPGLFARAPAKAAALAKTRAEHMQELAKAEEDWLEASVAIESKVSGY
jgi:ATP-binding cassette subfamily F protein 3